MAGTLLDWLPIPHDQQSTRYLDAGDVVFGIEYRFLRVHPKANAPEKGGGRPGQEADPVPGVVRDQGVSIHVFGRDKTLKECFRIDCFKRDPHYHYIWPDVPVQERFELDRVIADDIEAWAFDVIRNRLSRVMRRVGGPEVNQAAIEATMPALKAAVQRAKERAA